VSDLAPTPDPHGRASIRGPTPAGLAHPGHTPGAAPPPPPHQPQTHATPLPKTPPGWRRPSNGARPACPGFRSPPEGAASSREASPRPRPCPPGRACCSSTPGGGSASRPKRIVRSHAAAVPAALPGWGQGLHHQPSLLVLWPLDLAVVPKRPPRRPGASDVGVNGPYTPAGAVPPIQSKGALVINDPGAFGNRRNSNGLSIAPTTPPNRLPPRTTRQRVYRRESPLGDRGPARAAGTTGLFAAASTVTPPAGTALSAPPPSLRPVRHGPTSK
jgi:hypothetical protein